MSVLCWCASVYVFVISVFRLSWWGLGRPQGEVLNPIACYRYRRVPSRRFCCLHSIIFVSGCISLLLCSPRSLAFAHFIVTFTHLMGYPITRVKSMSGNHRAKQDKWEENALWGLLSGNERVICSQCYSLLISLIHLFVKGFHSADVLLPFSKNLLKGK